MNENNPPAGPSDIPPQTPPIEVRAEPARPEDRGRVYDAPPGTGSPPPRTPGGERAQPAAPNAGWATVCHVIGLVDFGLSPLFLGLIATLVVWLMRKDVDAEADYHGKEALNFQLNVLFWYFAAIPLIFCCGLGILMWVALPFVKIVLMLVGAVHAANGQRWRYPLVFRVLR